MSFRIEALPEGTLQSLFTATEQERALAGAKLVHIGEPHAAPCRISLEDAEPGETVLLAPFSHQPAHSPYRASGPIFVRRGARLAQPEPGEIPEALARRLISLRAYDAADEMIEADVADGTALAHLVGQFLGNPGVAYLHAHFARRGCYAARIVRT